MDLILKCSACNQALMLVKEPRQLPSGKKSKVMLDTLKCPNCGKDYRENPTLEGIKKLKRK